MVRKQLYIEQRQDKALKRRAKALGVSEAELVREAIDALLALESRRTPLSDGVRALAEFLDRARRLVAAGHRLPQGERLVRQSLYDERERQPLPR